MKLLLLITIISLASKPAKYHELDWSDFKGPKGTATAHTESQIVREWEDDGIVFTFKTWAEFLPHESYTRTADLYVLSHERLHYTLTRVYSAKIRTISSRPSGYTRKEADSLKSKINGLIEEWKRIEDVYDKETENSQNRKEQYIWQELINKQLCP